jgi:uncharacterized repeat protein (TIGR02543 family)
MKKSLALMLALIMALCMIPTTALAADMSWEWTVTIFGGNYYSADGTQTSTNKYTINQHLDNSVDHKIGYKFEWNASAGGSNYNGGWQLCLTVDGSIVERSTAYIYERNMSTASATWTAPKSSHTGNSTHPFTLYLSDYPAHFQKITLKYDANGGTNAPASETKQVEKGQSATFTVSNQKPTRENYTFKGWSTDENAATAEYIGGNNITISQDTTLYAVWEENNEPQPETPPAQPDPRPSATPTIDGLTGVQVVEVKCITENSGHAKQAYQLIEGSYAVGEVQGDKESGYTCDITVEPEKYVKAYNTEYSGHTLETEGQIGTIKLVWDKDNQKWQLANPSGVLVVFKVVCAPVVDPSKPEKPSDDAVEALLGGVVTIDCTNNKVTHEDKTYGLLTGGFSVGDVEGNKETGYTCDITVNPDKYVEAYNGEIKVKHILDPVGQTGKITLRWKPDVGQDGTGKWTVGSGTPVVFKVVCETGVTDKVTVRFNSNGGTAVAPQTINKGEKATRPANPTMDGYTFVNWYLDGKVYDFNTPVTEDITLHAQWKKNDDNPGQNPYPDPSPKPNPGGHDHGGSTVVVPITVYMPPKTGDMPFWYSIAQFLGLVK